jgi:hemerythrin
VAILEWEKNFELGIKEFDEHHKHLVFLLNEIYNWIEGDTADQTFEMIADKLVNYTNIHFAAEEKWMGSIGYDRMISHVEEHDKFNQMVAEFRSSSSQDMRFLAMELLSFLGHWLFDHILVADADYARFAGETGPATDQKQETKAV